MPAKSQAQYRFFKAMEENPAEAQTKGFSQPMAHEFTDPIENSGKKYFARLKERMLPKKPQF